jgi:hypothetical protein
VRQALIRRLRRWLYLTHRWIGVITCILFAMWFASGVVMMYVAFPSLTDKERLAALPPIAWDKVVLSPDQAMLAASATRFPQDLRLNMMGTEPIYRLSGWDGQRRTISAVDGRPIETITPDLAFAIARLHPAAVNVRLIDTVDRDQWSVTARYDPLRPLFRISLGDRSGTELYVSSRTGEIALDTTRTERIWNWMGSIPHWIYPTILRRDAPLWRQAIFAAQRVLGLAKEMLDLAYAQAPGASWQDHRSCMTQIRLSRDLRMSAKCWSGQQDSNLRPGVPKTPALPGCAIPRQSPLGEAPIRDAEENDALASITLPRQRQCSGAALRSPARWAKRGPPYFPETSPLPGNVSGERSEWRPGRRPRCRVSSRCRPLPRARLEPARPKE